MRQYLAESIIERLFKQIKDVSGRLSPSRKKGEGVTEEALMVSAHHLLTGSLDERAAAVVHLSADTDHLSQAQLLQVRSLCFPLLLLMLVVVNTPAVS